MHSVATGRFRYRVVGRYWFRWVLTGWLWAGTLPVRAQSRLTQFINRISQDTTAGETSRWLFYPTLAFAPETSLNIGGRVFKLYYARQDTLVNRLSDINAVAFATLREQFGLWVENILYTDKNRFLIFGRSQFQRSPLLYYGIGPRTREADRQLVDALFGSIRQRVLRQVRGNWYVGGQLDLQSVSRVSFAREGTGFALPIGGRGSLNLGLGLTGVYDSRRNVLNPRRGFFTELGRLWYNPAWDSAFQYGGWLLDGRAYWPSGSRQVLAIQGYAVSMEGQVPFNNLALLGGESLMRGYYLGRFRDKNLAAVQAEYRWLPFSFSRRSGGAVFAGAGTVGPTGCELLQSPLRWSAGAGLRYRFFTKKDVFMRTDFALTNEGTGIYIQLGEAF